MDDDIKAPAEQTTPPLGQKKSKLPLNLSMSSVGIISAVIAFVFGISLAMSQIKVRDPAPVAYAGGYNGGSLGCTLNNDAFSKPLNLTADEVIAKITDSSLQKNLSKSKEQLQQIIDKWDSSGVNPAVLIAIWAGEQSFSNNDSALKKAFGCGVYDSDHDKKIENLYPRFTTNSDGKGQLECSIDCIKDAINNTGHYTKPTGTDTFTRLFYNYTGTMRATYDKTKAYVADEKNVRIRVLKMLIPEQVVCKGTGDGGGLAIRYYSQGGGNDWASKTTRTKSKLKIFESGNQMEIAGCGITTVAMLASYYNNADINPGKVADDIIDKCGAGCGSNFREYVQKDKGDVVRKLYGINIQLDKTVTFTSGQSQDFPVAWIKEQTNQNNAVVLRIREGSSMHGHTFAKGHYSVIKGIDSNNGVLVNDPAFSEYSGSKSIPTSDFSGTFEFYPVTGR